jgi:DNA-binding LacI/PurR family transcriptional regulator
LPIAMPDPHVVYAISARSLVQPRTVQRVLEGHPCKRVTRARVERAAAELGLEIGPAQPAAAVPAPRRGRRALP